jgi:hypothetical protein
LDHIVEEVAEKAKPNQEEDDGCEIEVGKQRRDISLGCGSAARAMRTRSVSSRVCWRMGWPVSGCMTNTVGPTHVAAYMHGTVMCNTVCSPMTKVPQYGRHDEEKQSKQKTSDEHKGKRISCD